jgi:general secretion pathway protein D
MNSRTHALAAAGALVSKILFVLALFAIVVGPVAAKDKLYTKSVNGYYKDGQAAEAREDYDRAFEDYQKGASKDPKDGRFKVALARVRVTASSMHITKGRKLLDQGDVQGAVTEFLHAAEIDPSNEAAQQELARARKKQGATTAEIGVPQTAAQQELESIGAPVALKPLSNEPLSLHMTEDAKVVYEAVGKAAGVNILFDPDYIPKRIQVDLNSVSLLDALRIVSVMSNSFWRPVTSNTIFVAQNTVTKHKDLDEQAVQTFYLANAWQQNDLNDVQTALRNVMQTVKAYAVQGQNAIVMRGTPDELLLAQKIINDLDKPRGEVVVDIAIIEVSKNWERNLGLAWPSSVGVKMQASCAETDTCSSSTSSSGSSTTNDSPTLYDLGHPSSSDFALTIGSATLELLLTDDNTTVLQSPRIRATDAQKATMKIGSRIPIATGSYSNGTSTSNVSSLVNTQFQYQDIGVNIEMTPTIHYDHDVTLKIKIEVSSHSSDETISGVTEPIISQRVVDQTLRLREGEASILGGIQNQEVENNWSGVPGLSAIPVLKYLFGNRDRIVQDDDLVFVVVPHIVRSQELSSSNLRVIDTGSGQNNIDLRHIAPAGASQNAALPTPPQRPAVGTAPAQSALEAAPKMLAQLRADIAATEASAFRPQAALPASNQATGASAPVAAQIAPANAAKSAVAPAVAYSGKAGLMLNAPAAPLAVGSSFQIPVVFNGAADVASVALQLHYDAAKLTLVNVANGDLLSRDGQSAQSAHTDDPAGNLTLGLARPPGAPGISGTGVLCVLTIQAKAAGQSPLSISRAAVVNSAQQQLPVESSQAVVVVK